VPSRRGNIGNGNEPSNESVAAVGGPSTPPIVISLSGGAAITVEGPSSKHVPDASQPALANALPSSEPVTPTSSRRSAGGTSPTPTLVVVGAGTVVVGIVASVTDGDGSGTVVSSDGAVESAPPTPRNVDSSCGHNATAPATAATAAAAAPTPPSTCDVGRDPSGATQAAATTRRARR
jgi:hypothetical protein